MITVRRSVMFCLWALVAVAASGCGAYPAGFRYYACDFSDDACAVMVSPELGLWWYYYPGDHTWSSANSLSNSRKVVAYGTEQWVTKPSGSESTLESSRVWSVVVEDWARKRQWRLRESKGVSLALSPDAKRVAFLGYKHNGPYGVHVWDYEKGTVTYITGDAIPVEFTMDEPSLSWLSDTRLVVALDDDRICSFDVTGTQPPVQLATGRYPVVSPDGRYMAYLAGLKHVIRDLSSGEETVLTVLPDHFRSTEVAAWTPDSRYVGYVKYKDGLDKQLLMRRMADGETFQIAGFYGIWAYSRRFYFVDEDFVQLVKARSGGGWVFGTEPRR